MGDKLKIAIVDDHEMFRSGIKFIFSEKPEWEVVIEAENGKDFIEAMETVLPDVVLLDITMPVMNGFEAAKIAMQKHPEIKVVVLSMHSDQDYYYKMIELGVHAFIPKSASIDELIHAINEVANKNNYFSQELLKKIVVSLNNKASVDKLQLGKKEKLILSLICSGDTNKEIANKLLLSIKTIEKYRNGLLKKTGTKNTAQLVMFAIRYRYVEL